MTNVHHRSPKLLRCSIILSALILLVNLVLMLFVPAASLRVVLADLSYPLWTLLATIALSYAAKRSVLHSRRLFLAWASLALAQLSFTGGNIILALLTIGLGAAPFPSLADGFYLAYYPLFLLGILLLPARRLKLLDWWKTVLDRSIVMGVTMLGFWNYLLAPLAAAVGEQRLFVQLTSLAYPMGDLILLWAALTLLYRHTEGQRWSPLFLLALGTGLMIIADCNYVYQSMLGTYVQGGWLDLGWLLSYLISGFAGIWHATSMQPASQPAAEPKDGGAPSRLNTWRTYLPYGWAIAAYLILEQSQIPDVRLGVLLSWGGEIIIGLVLLRQMVTLRENSLLFAQVRQQTEELQREVEERKRIEAQLAYDASHDALTGLANRALFMDRLHHAITFAKRQAGYRFAVLFLDLDHFKAVNDSLGHAFGDQLLIGIGRRLRLCLRNGDTVARLGGDEFVVILEDTQDLQQASAAADRIQASLQQPFDLDGHQLFAAASIGIIADASGYDQSEAILHDADLAMYQAKTHGKARSELFHVTMCELSQTGLGLENGLRQVLARREVSTNGVVSLCRWAAA